MTADHARLVLYPLTTAYLFWVVIACCIPGQILPFPPIWPAWFVGMVLADGIDLVKGTHGQ